MKLARTALIAAVLTLPAASANAVVLDLYTMTCKQFVESDKDTIGDHADLAGRLVQGRLGRGEDRHRRVRR